MDQVMTTTNTTASIPEVWSRKWYEVLLAELPFNAIISREYEGEIQDVGDTVNISSVPEFAEGDDYDEDERSDAEALTVSGQQLVINQRTKKDFIVTKQSIIQSLEMMTKLRDMAIYAILKRIQTKIIAAIVPSTSAPDHTIGYTSGTTLALADLLNGKELLDTANVPAGDRHAALGSAQTNDIFNITGFTSSDFLVAGSPLSTGQVPQQLLGFSPHLCNALGNVAALFHRSFMTMAAQKGVSVAQYDLGVDGTRATRVNVDTLWGLKQLDNKRVVTLT